MWFRRSASAKREPATGVTSSYARTDPAPIYDRYQKGAVAVAPAHGSRRGARRAFRHLNTAASDETPGAEGLSGLTKAFFYAGSRSLLVSHWAVASDAAVKLTTGMFAVLADRSDIGRAEALQHAMLALVNDEENPHFAHPMFWAPFSVVGEGGNLG